MYSFHQIIFYHPRELEIGRLKEAYWTVENEINLLCFNSWNGWVATEQRVNEIIASPEDLVHPSLCYDLTIVMSGFDSIMTWYAWSSIKLLTSSNSSQCAPQLMWLPNTVLHNPTPPQPGTQGQCSNLGSELFQIGLPTTPVHNELMWMLLKQYAAYYFLVIH